MADFILELYSEEIPATMQAKAGQDIIRLFETALADYDIEIDPPQAHVAPQRLALLAQLPSHTPAKSEQRKGPRLNAPEKAIKGFMKSVNVSNPDMLEVKEDPKGDYYVFIQQSDARPMPQLLQEIIPALIRNFPWPKSMRWLPPTEERDKEGDAPLRWIRPLRAILCRFDKEIIPFTLNGITSGGVSYGHRFLSPAAIEIKHSHDYLRNLEEHFVLADSAIREALIVEEGQRLAHAQGLSMIEDMALVQETAGLVEWPVPFIGKIDDEFMDVPEEVLITAMRNHQRYFSLRAQKTGKMAPYFIAISNMVTEDEGALIRAGNERVLRARLSDAAFFWQQDQKTPLASLLPQLGEIVFHAKLGSVYDKVKRLEKLAASLADTFAVEQEKAQRAAELSKSDLVTSMVYEFPELQGIMGRYYALANGEDEDVAAAIGAHYSPLGPSDAVPETRLGCVVALADKIDTLAGFWLIDETPTGSKDPYALRRAAYAIIRILLETKTRLPLHDIFTAAIAAYDSVSSSGKNEDKLASLINFIADRLKVHLREQGIAHDIVAAIVADISADDDLVTLVERTALLSEFLQSEDGENLLAAYIRADGICKKADNVKAVSDASLFEEAAEGHLFEALCELDFSNKKDAAAYAANLQNLAALREPVDAFFETVMVNVEDADIRRNRQALLAQLIMQMNKIADLSQIKRG